MVLSAFDRTNGSASNLAAPVIVVSISHRFQPAAIT
jgi:hypothetical protein